MTQVDIIRKQLLEGNTLTQRSALLDFGIMALPRRIADLKEEGFPVKVEMKTNPHTGQRYASYSMSDLVENIRDLRPDCVYRVIEVAKSPFHPTALETSQGYFTPLRHGDKTSDDIMIRMAGIPQMLCQSNLDNELFKVKYIGGMA